MKDKVPDFYIASVDTGPVINPRKCFLKEKLVFEGRGDIVLLIEIEPPIIHPSYWRPPSIMVKEAVVAAHFVAEKLDPINKWPMDVYIYRIVNEQFKGSGSVSPTDLVNQYLGELYPTLEDAEKNVEKYRRIYGEPGI